MLFWLSHYTRAQYKTRKETNVLIIVVVMYLVLLFRESLKRRVGLGKGLAEYESHFPTYILSRFQ